MDKVLSIEESSDRIYILLWSGLIEIIEKSELIPKRKKRHFIQEEDQIESTYKGDKIEATPVENNQNLEELKMEIQEEFK